MRFTLISGWLLAQYSDLDKHDQKISELTGWMLLSAVGCVVVIVFWYISKTSRSMLRKEKREKQDEDRSL